MSPPTPTPEPRFQTVAQRGLVAACVVAIGFIFASTSPAQSVPGTPSAMPPNAEQIPDAVNPQSMSCEALKARIKGTGELRILSGPRGAWPDTFYGPAAPRCQFWQMPQFTYVRTSDGLCGIGYICVDKLSRD